MQLNVESIISLDQMLLSQALSLDPPSARTEVQCLLQQVLMVERAYFYAHPERILSETESVNYQALLQRRLAGEPIAYILGKREFFGLNFFVSPATLIPRPETELLVELVLARSDVNMNGMRILDLGTGSGAIALSLAHHLPKAEVWACDISSKALTIARKNAEQLGISTVRFVESDWYEGLSNQCFNLIVSNPPYIEESDPHLSQGDLRFEPVNALAAGSDGLNDLRHIALNASSHLENNGWLLMEHGYNQAEPVREILKQAGFNSVFSAKDISGIERCSGGFCQLS